MTDVDRSEKIVELEKELYFNIIKLTSRIQGLKTLPVFSMDNIEELLTIEKAKLTDPSITDTKPVIDEIARLSLLLKERNQARSQVNQLELQLNTEKNAINELRTNKEFYTLL